MAWGRGLLAALALASAFACAREPVPPELIGQWHTDDPRYAGRSLAIGMEWITFGAGPEGNLVYRVRGIERAPDGESGTLYSLFYDAPEEPERTLRVRLPAQDQLEIENHSERWSRAATAPSHGG